MEDRSIRKKQFIWRYFFSVLILFSILIIAAGVLHPLTEDDFGFHHFSMNNGLIQFLLSQYLGWEGRITSPLIAWLGLGSFAARTIFGALNGVAFVFTVYASIALAIGKKPKLFTRDRLLFILMFGVLWFGLPVVGETVLWRTGAAFYMIPALLALTFLLPFRFWSPNSDLDVKLRRGSWIVILFFTGLFAGFAHEQLFTTVLGFLSVWFICVFRKRMIKTIPPSLLSGTVGFFIGGIIMIVAPGNFVRLAHQQHASFSLKVLNFIYYVWGLYGSSDLWVWLLLLLMLALSNTFKAQSETEYKSSIDVFLIFFSASFGGLLPMLLLSSFAVPRTGYFSVLFMVIGFASLYNPQEDGLIRAREAIVILASFIIVHMLLFDIATTVKTAWNFRVEVAQRNATIESLKQKGVENIKVPAFYTLPTRTVHLDDVTSDANNPINRAEAQYYDVKSIVLSPDGTPPTELKSGGSIKGKLLKLWTIVQ